LDWQSCQMTRSQLPHPMSHSYKNKKNLAVIFYKDNSNLVQFSKQPQTNYKKK
jgi:hypothetical protein